MAQEPSPSPLRAGPAYVVLVRSKTDPALVQLYVVGASSSTIASIVARRVLGSDVTVEANAQPLSAGLANTLGVKPGEVRRF